MADRRLDRSDDRALGERAALFEDLLEHGDLDFFARPRACAVAFDEADRGRRESGLLVGAPQGDRLALGPRRGESLVLAVARRTDTLDHGVDLVPIPFGIGEPLENEESEPLANGDPVGALVERPAKTARAEGLGLAEAEIGKGVHHRVGRAAEHHVARARLELAHRRVEGGQR